MRCTMDYCLCCTIKGWWLFSQWPLTLRNPLGLHQISLLCTSKHKLTVSPTWEESSIEKIWPLERYLSPRKMSKLRLEKMRNIKGADLKMFTSNTAHLERSRYAINLWIGRDWYGNGLSCYFISNYQDLWRYVKHRCGAERLGLCGAACMNF